MKNLVIIFGLLMASAAGAQSGSGRDFCTEESLRDLNAAWTEMRSEGAAARLGQARVGFRIGDCGAYSLQKIALRPHRQNAPRPFCGLVLILSADQQQAQKQAGWVLDHFGDQYTTGSGAKVKLCGRLSSGAGPRPGVTVTN